MTIFLFTFLSLLLLVSAPVLGDHKEGEPLLREGLFYLPFHDEPLTGKYIGWYENGQKKSESTYRNGKQVGLIVERYENGQKKTEENYKDGKLDGLSTEWYENGQKDSASTYKYEYSMVKRLFFL